MQHMSPGQRWPVGTRWVGWRAHWDQAKLILRAFLIFYGTTTSCKVRAFSGFAGQGCPDAEGPSQAPRLGKAALPPTITEAIDTVSTALGLVHKSAHIPALSVGIVYNDTLLWSKGYGTKDLNDPNDVPNEHTIFRIGSISKVFAMLSMMATRDGGRIRLDDEVAQHVPYFGIQPPPEGRPAGQRGVTFRQLATHLAAMPREVPCDRPGSGHCNYSQREMFGRVARLRQLMAPDTLPLYSNLGFAVLGNALAVVNGMEYEEMVQEFILRRLGMERTGTNTTVMPRDNYAHPYHSGGVACGAYCLVDYGWANTCGGMFSTVADMAKLVGAYLSGSSEFLSPGSLKETLLPQFIDSDSLTGMGLTFKAQRFGKYWVHQKAGDVPGYASEIMMVPELRLGIVVMANIMGQEGRAMQAMARILVPAFEAVWRSAGAAEARNPRPPLPLTAYAGRYFNDSEGYALPITVDSTGSRLLFGNASDGTFPSELQWAGLAVSSQNPFVERSSSAPLRLPHLKSHIFRKVVAPGNSGSCGVVENGAWGQLVEFHFHPIRPDVPSTVTLDTEWGVLWEREHAGQLRNSWQ